MITLLTEGKPAIKLLKLSLPMVLSMIFQQVYNLADALIVGNFLGGHAFSAVGEAFSVTMVFMGIATGASVGVAVTISRFFGAQKHTDLKTCINTALISSLVLSAVLSLVGIFFCGPLMTLMGAHETFKDLAAEYLSIYFYGFCFVFIYNTVSGVFNALGDSVTSLVFLVFSSILNIVLDILFVPIWGVAGAAWATLISQFLATALSVFVLFFKLRKIKCQERPRLFSFSALKNISKVALPSILQQSFVSVGNLFVIGRLNNFSGETVAGFLAAIKLNTFAVSCLVTVSNAASAFTAQNLGVRNTERVKKGATAAVLIAWAIGLPFMLLFLIFGKSMVGLFVAEETQLILGEELNRGLILAAGSRFLLIVAPFYLMIALKIVADGVQRGAENMPAFLLSTFSDLLLRVALTYILTLEVVGMGESGIFWSWPIGWGISTVVALLFYFSGGWKKKALKT